MEKIQARSAIKLTVPEALTKAEVGKISLKDRDRKSITLYMSKSSISELRLAHKQALNENLKQFFFEGNIWLTEFAETALNDLEKKGKKRGW